MQLTDAEWIILDQAMSEYHDHIESEEDYETWANVLIKIDQVLRWLRQNLSTFLWTF